MDTKRSEILELSRRLHTSSDPLWARLRTLLHERGLRPEDLLLVECFPDDTQFEFGIVVTPDRDVFEFGLDYLHKTVEHGVFSEWRNLSENYQATPHRAGIAIALEMIASTDANTNAAEA
jgi:hypothetical protein